MLSRCACRAATSRKPTRNSPILISTCEMLPPPWTRQRTSSNPRSGKMRFRSNRELCKPCCTPKPPCAISRSPSDSRQEVANQQQNPQQAFQQRWEQEMLRREAEQLRQQMEQLAEKGQQGSSGSQSGQSSQQQSSLPQDSSGSARQSDSRTQPGSQSAREQGGNASSASPSGSVSEAQIAQALNRLRQAINNMRNGGDPGRDRANAQQAAEQLRQASGLLAATQQRLASGKVDTLAREAGRLSHEESTQADRINKFASQDAPNLTDLNSMLTRRRELTQLAE